MMSWVLVRVFVYEMTIGAGSEIDLTAEEAKLFWKEWLRKDGGEILRGFVRTSRSVPTTNSYKLSGSFNSNGLSSAGFGGCSDLAWNMVPTRTSVTAKVQLR